jgi:hypothetical protein
MANQTLEQEYEALFKEPAYDDFEEFYTLGYVEWLETKVSGLRKSIFKFRKKLT